MEAQSTQMGRFVASGYRRAAVAGEPHLQKIWGLGLVLILVAQVLHGPWEGGLDGVFGVCTGVNGGANVSPFR